MTICSTIHFYEILDRLFSTPLLVLSTGLSLCLLGIATGPGLSAQDNSSQATPVGFENSTDSLTVVQSKPQAEDQHYYVIQLSDLDIAPKSARIHFWSQVLPYATVEGVDRVWVCPDQQKSYTYKYELAIQSSKPLKTIKGKIFLPNEKQSALDEFPFSFSVEAQHQVVFKEEFLAALEKHYEHLVNRNFTGRTWFQHRLKEIREEIGKKGPIPNNRNMRGINSMDRTFELFSGARAISENIQLDRDLQLNRNTSGEIDVNSIEGITIKEVDWDELLAEKMPKLDALAKYVPHDQHVIFFSSLIGIEQALQEATGFISPAMGAFAQQSIDRQVIPSYFRQMAIDMRELAGQEAVRGIKEIAVTGSDPFSEIGTDVGVLIQFGDSRNAKAFADWYLERIQSPGNVTEIKNSGWNATTDRSLSAYCMRSDSLVVISNSEFQLRRIDSVIKREFPSLSGLNEYHFFRQRYVKSDDETAFVYMSDPAIRRWCSPRWRIGQSRRLRALAMMQQLQCKQMQSSVAMKENEWVDVKLDAYEKKVLGLAKKSRAGIHSSNFGTTRFMTPIAEMDIDKVSEQERNAYVSWRDNYQRNWSRAFDPIGIQLKLQSKRMEIDLSVIPLIMSSSYRWLAEGKPMVKDIGDLHEGTLMHVVAAPGLDNFIRSFLEGLQSIEFYADDDPQFWRDFTDEKEMEKYFRENINRLPIALALHFDNEKNMERTIEFAKAAIASNIRSETEVTHKGAKYKKLEIDASFIMPDNVQNLYVLRRGSSVYFALSEKLVRSSIERQGNSAKTGTTRNWLGKHLAIQLDNRFFRVMEGLSSNEYQKMVRRQSWSHIPILNEWRREFPGQDALEMHEAYWGERLLCAGGGKFSWDPKVSSYQSTAFGSPARPRIPMGTPFPLREFKTVDAGLSFDTGGIRAKFMVEKK